MGTLPVNYAVHLCRLSFQQKQSMRHIISIECVVTFTFAICYRPSVYL